MDNGKVYFGSLFAGIGGLDLGLERAGMECRWQVENDRFCNKILEKHWPEVGRYEDVKEVDPRRIEKECGRIQLVAGGFPCQDLSFAGKRKGIHAERSGLWFEFERFIRVLRPEVVLVENVPGLLSGGIDVVLGCLAALGYDAEWDCIPAAVFGAPHLRHRVFIVAYPNGPYGSWKEGDETDRCSKPGRGNSSKVLQGGLVADTGGIRQQKTTKEASEGQAGIWEDRSGADKRGGIGGGTEGGKDSYTEGGRQRLRNISQGVDDVHVRGKEKLVLGDDGPGLGGVWPVEAQPRVVRVADGVPGGLDEARKKEKKEIKTRIRSLGNAVVPQVAEWLGRRILWAMGRGLI